MVRLAQRHMRYMQCANAVTVRIEANNARIGFGGTTTSANEPLVEPLGAELDRIAGPNNY